jgi:hypothetical protein
VTAGLVFARASRDSLQQGNRTREECALAHSEGAERRDERGDAALPAIVQHLGSAGSRAHAHDAPVGRVGLALDEALRLELDDQLGDGRGPHLLGARELAQGERAAEDDHGEGGELRGGEAGGIVLAAEASEEMDGGGMEAIGEVDGSER